MAADAKSLVFVLCTFLALVGTVIYSVRHPETGYDLYESQER